MNFSSFKQAQEFLYKQIPSDKAKRYPGEFGLGRMRYFLSLIGDPQNKLKVIHIAGTSGKGSTAYLISILLVSQGFKVGLHVSPHLVDIRERCQINNKLISEKDFIDGVNDLFPAYKKISKTKWGSPTYFELLTALAYLIFQKKKVDYAVIETGLGGWYDATNTVSRQDKVAVLTKIGLDHTEILGKTIDEIALQKAKIIQNGNVAFSIEQEPEAKKIIEKIAKEQNAKLTFVKKQTDFRLGLMGDYQYENASLALVVVNYLSKRDKFKLESYKVRKVLKGAKFPGRFEIIKFKNKTLILDGAHNPQKMKAFITSLKKLFPSKKFDFLVAFKKEKDYSKMLRLIVPIAKTITITSFSLGTYDLKPMSEKPEIIVKELQKLKFQSYFSIQDPIKAYKKVLSEKNNIVITGSLYLLAKVYPKVISK